MPHIIKHRILFRFLLLLTYCGKRKPKNRSRDSDRLSKKSNRLKSERNTMETVYAVNNVIAV